MGKLVSENNLWRAEWVNSKRIRLICKYRQRIGQRPCTAYVTLDNRGVPIYHTEIPIPVNVKAWASVALRRGTRWTQ